MDQHSIASNKAMENILRARGSTSTPSTSSSTLTASSSSSNLQYTPAYTHSAAVPSIVAQSGYHAVAHTSTVQNPQLLAQNKKRAAAERAAIQQKIKNNITKSQQEAKKQKENHEKTRLWEEVVLPHFDEYVNTAKMRDLCQRGVPNKLRGRVWPLLVGNELGIDEQMFETLCVEAQFLFHDKMTAARYVAPTGASSPPPPLGRRLTLGASSASVSALSLSLLCLCLCLCLSVLSPVHVDRGGRRR